MNIQPNYNEIITNVPIDGMLEYFVSAMKIAERDYFCSPKTFVKGLFDEIKELSKQFSDDFEKQKAYYINEINNTCSYEGVYYQLNGLNRFNITDDDRQKAKEYNLQRTTEYLDILASEFKEVTHKKEIKDQYILLLLKQVDELMKIHLGRDKYETDDEYEYEADDPQPQQNGKQYKPDDTLFKMIYKHCQDRDIFNIDEAEFLQRIERADLSGEIYNNGNKTKINILIKMIGRENAICESWYTEAVENLETTKHKLTKAIDYKLEDEIKAIIDEWRGTRKAFYDGAKSKIKSLNPT